MLGKLSWAAIPFDQPIPLIASGVVGLVIIGVFAFVRMVGLAALGAYATFVVFAWRDKDEYIIPAETVARIDRANRSARTAAFARREAAP